MTGPRLNDNEEELLLAMAEAGPPGRDSWIDGRALGTLVGRSPVGAGKTAGSLARKKMAMTAGTSASRRYRLTRDGYERALSIRAETGGRPVADHA